MKFFNTVMGILIAIMLFQIFWPLLVFLLVAILLYGTYMRFKIKSAMKNAEGMYQQESQDYSSDFDGTAYSNKGDSNNSEVIDVEFSEREVK